MQRPRDTAHGRLGQPRGTRGRHNHRATKMYSLNAIAGNVQSSAWRGSALWSSREAPATPPIEAVTGWGDTANTSSLEVSTTARVGFSGYRCLVELRRVLLAMWWNSQNRLLRRDTRLATLGESGFAGSSRSRLEMARTPR